MSKGNNLFVRAQKSHKYIMDKREAVHFDCTLINECYQGIQSYLTLLLMAQQLKAQSTLLETVSFLQSCGVKLGKNSMQYAFVLQAMFSLSETEDVELLHQMVHSYISLRAQILEYMLETYEPEFHNGIVYHYVTGVRLDANEFSYKFTLEQFYDI